MGELSLDRSLVGHFAPLEDPRDALRRRHKLIDMIVIAIAAVLCGADGWVAIAAFGRAKEAGFGSSWSCPTASRRTIPSGGCSRCWRQRPLSRAFGPGWPRFGR
jgi:hypothetical protein